MDDDRIQRLEVRVEETTKQINHKLDGIADALQILVRIEERQAFTNNRLAEGAQRMSDHDARIKALEMAQPPELEKRLLKIETHMPSLIESRKWVVAGVLGGIALMGVALLKLVLVS